MDRSNMVQVRYFRTSAREQAGTYHHESLVRPSPEGSLLPAGMWGAEISLEAVVINHILREDLERDYGMENLPQDIRDEVWRQTLLQSTRSLENTNPLNDGTVSAMISQYGPLALYAAGLYEKKTQRTR